MGRIWSTISTSATLMLQISTFSQIFYSTCRLSEPISVPRSSISDYHTHKDMMADLALINDMNDCAITLIQTHLKKYLIFDKKKTVAMFSHQILWIYGIDVRTNLLNLNFVWKKSFRNFFSLNQRSLFNILN